MAWTYILRCIDDSYYVGSTINLEYRVAQHQAGEGAAYTRKRRPVTVVWAEEHPDISVAFAREKQVQGWSRAKREALIRGDFDALPGLSKNARNRRRSAEQSGSQGPPTAS